MKNTVVENALMSVRTRESEGRVKRWQALACAVGLAVLLPVQAWAQNMIRSISATQQSGTDIVRIELAQPLTELPRGFAVQVPPRIALDLPGVSNGLGRNAVEINSGNMRSANVAQAGDRSRVVLNLRQASTFRAQLQDNSLLIFLDAAAGAAPAATAAAAAEPVHFAPSQNAAAQGLQDIDFRRGNDGAGRVVVNLPSSQVGVDTSSRGRTWWWSSCAARCRSACVASWTSPTSERRCNRSPPRSRVIACVWS